jgi:hypothetical protein
MTDAIAPADVPSTSTIAAPAGGNAGAASVAASALTGWAAFQQAVNESVPAALTDIERTNQATLQILTR